MATIRTYGVSTGNGNDGVSHTYADYYVKTDSPWLLAHCAVLAEFKPGKGREFAIEETDIDGESDCTITACIYDPPRDEQDFPVTELESGKWIVDDEPDEEYDSEDEAVDAGFVGVVGGDDIRALGQVLQPFHIEVLENILRKENLHQADGPALRTDIFGCVAKLVAQHQVKRNRGGGEAESC